MVDFTVQFGLVGYHSGEVGGIVPDTFRIARELISRFENSQNGDICKELYVSTPEWKN